MSDEAIRRGYHFMPTEEELIAILIDFLECRSKKEKQFPPIPVAEKLLYGDNATPWKIFGHDDAWASTETDGGKKGAMEVAYVLTPLISMTTNKTTNKTARTAGCGTWKAQTGIREIKNREGLVIGVRKMLSYRVKEDSQSQPDKAQWRMHEYALAGVSLEEMKLKHIDIGNYVICKVTRDSTKCASPAMDQILNERESDVTAETSTHHSNQFKRFKELVNSEAQEPVYNTNPTAPQVAETSDPEDDKEWPNYLDLDAVESILNEFQGDI